jgi:hypothetical protein
MKGIYKLFTIALMFTLMLVGCRSAPVMNIDSAAIVVNEKHTSKDIKKAIIRAGASLGWNMQSKKNGHIIGTLHLRAHRAVIDILYNKNNYSIKYKSSTNLDYDGVNIHSNYNGWIQRLNQNIQIQINTL